MTNKGGCDKIIYVDTMLSLYYSEVIGVENVMLLGISRNMPSNGRTVFAPTIACLRKFVQSIIYIQEGKVYEKI